MARFFKPPFPVLQGNHPLARNLLFAVCGGWTKGLGLSAGTPFITRDSRSKIQGDQIGAGVLQVGNGDAGQNLQSADVPEFRWPIPGRGAPLPWLAGAPISFAVLVRMLNIPGPSVGRPMVFHKRADTSSGTAGFTFYLETVGSIVWAAEWSDGVSDQEIEGTTVPDLETTYLLVGVIDVQGNVGELWVNGVKEVSASLIEQPIDDASEDYKAGGDEPDQIFMCAAWQKALNPHEIARLWADPYCMWR